jgi:hypothetical protein
MNTQQIIDTLPVNAGMPVQPKSKRSGSCKSSRSSPPPKKQTAAKTRTSAKPPKPAMASNSKSDQVLLLLRRKGGASIAELQKQTGWQPHSVRGFLSGTVRKKLGLELLSQRTEKGERRYSVGKS